MKLQPVDVLRYLLRIGGGIFLLSAIHLPASELSTSPGGREPADLTGLSLEELGSMKVTSVSKKPERLAAASSAVSVITGEDIRRSGALTLPEALRLAPGVIAAKVDAQEWAVSVRGFNDTTAQKLLVLMDGRSVYSPMFSGTFWQAQDVMLEDVDRIEVVRGPGGTVWGANAVNGVINIVSKPARETQGLLLTGGAGSARTALAGARYGATIGTNVFLRVYAKYDDANESRLVGGGDAHDAWRKSQGGFRLDWEPSLSDRLTLQGDVFGLRSDIRQPQIVFPVFLVPPPPQGYNFARNTIWEQQGGNLLGRWTRELSADSEFSLQTYYDRTQLQMLLLDEARDTFDLDLRYRFPLGTRNEIVVGGGYRLSSSRIEESEMVTFSRTARSDQTFNAFVQDEIKIIPDRLRWTLGSKIEHNDYTGYEFEPGAHLAWTPTDRQTFWASVARAVRTPAQFERDANVNLAVLPPSPPLNPLPSVITVTGNPHFKSESLIAYELGWRIQAHRRLTLDVAGFLNDYNSLRSRETTVNSATAPNYVQIQSGLVNDGRGQTYGGELASTWQVANWWRLYGQLSIFQTDLEQPPDPVTGATTPLDLSSPKYQASLRSSLGLGRDVDLDFWVRYVDSVPQAGVNFSPGSSVGTSVSSYVTFDVRLAWRPRKNMEMALVGQNLAGPHREFNPSFISSQYTEVSRSVYGKLTLSF